MKAIAPPGADAMLLRLVESLEMEDGRWRARQGGWLLDSHFQPVFSFPHRRAVGYEALLRVADASGEQVSPLKFFEQLRSFDQQWAADRLCRLLHVHNFVHQAGDEGWLFLNIHPAVFVHGAQQMQALESSVRTLQSLGLPMHRVVLEVTEDVMSQQADFERAVANVRQTGCLLALDDFGAGHSNFDRIWHIHPEIVKLDRSLLRRACGSPRIARVLAQMVSLLHECGSLVLLEGVETRDEALLALDVDVDMVQGFVFGRPVPGMLGPQGVSDEIEEIWELLDGRHADTRRVHAAQIAPYREALRQAQERLAGQALPAACAELLALAGVQVCFLLDEQGRHVAEPLLPPGVQDLSQDPRFKPLGLAGEARWARRPYFRRALEEPGVIQMTRPYLSLHGARMCVTLSVACPTPDGLRVLCTDIDWMS
ncbi:EAL domain-containing protein (putative c-di-GMP-specific phosphodiesterase class I) [Pelomonas saccharophila]|uniref:EAL domain-containing protein (Putative c-di-GMP-specific phosphodiesterase class I) n=1 Tax=Roseateles saccharophilus TaxID=304 RepID=A0ABU1YKH0_ROSSA|nr:EAL domain-containing protein [Roseateles saccharophilus]MDR7268686.1 EAL domain-containing protein (putative c-di-GMP-specific phosphodiesterase class I) [Roseateles saccharophilus]